MKARKEDTKSRALLVNQVHGEIPAELVRDPWETRGGDGAGGRAPGAAPVPAAPSLSEEEQLKQENEERSRQSKARKVVFCIEENVRRMTDWFGLGCLGFLTLTFAEDIQFHQEASRRFNSFNTGFLSKQDFGPWIRVAERQKNGRIHYHIIIALPCDIREGFNFETGRGNGKGWVWVCKVRKQLRDVMPKYGFGRAELMPLKKDSAAGANYLAKYVAKALSYRAGEDRCRRLVAYSRGDYGWLHPEGFSFCRGGPSVWRRKLASWTFRMGYYSPEELRKWLGARWCFNNRRAILEYPISYEPMGPFPPYHFTLTSIGPTQTLDHLPF